MPADAAPAWLWLPGVAAREPEFTLDDDDGHYVARVCRASPGDRLHATDGEGAIATLQVLATRGEVRVARIETRREPAPPPVVVACGAPERDRADWMIEKLAELGVTEFQPLECERAGWERFASRAVRLERLAIAALRQSRRAWRLRLREPLAPSAWVEGLPGAGSRWLADPEGERPAPSPSAAGDFAAIGPSPGFSPAERQAFVQAGFRPVRLARGRLRTETAALVWAGLHGALGTPPSAAE